MKTAVAYKKDHVDATVYVSDAAECFHRVSKKIQNWKVYPDDQPANVLQFYTTGQHWESPMMDSFQSGKLDEDGLEQLLLQKHFLPSYCHNVLKDMFNKGDFRALSCGDCGARVFPPLNAQP